MKTAQDFIEFFEKIDESKWYAGGTFVDPENNDCKCALGHLGWTPYNSGTQSGRDLLSLLSKVGHVAEINDGHKKHSHLGSTPKERIINALKKVQDEESK